MTRADYSDFHVVRKSYFPDIHWRVAEVNGGNLYAYVDGYKYKKPEYCSHDFSTEQEAVDCLTAKLRAWRPSLLRRLKWALFGGEDK